MIHPTLKKTPKGYYEWLMNLAQKEDDIRWSKTPNNPLPPYEKKELKHTKASVCGLGKEIIKIICI